MSTITGPIKKADNTPFVGDIIVRPINPPRADAPDLIEGSDIIVTTDNAGLFSKTLRVGDYYVFLGGGNKRFKIAIPDDDATYTLLSRIVTALAYGSTEAPSAGSPVATADVTGTSRASETVADPIALTLETEEFVRMRGNQLQYLDGDGLWYPVVMIKVNGVRMLTIGDTGEE
jgi:hypothetical protein